jgi:hypothetical protein
MNNENTELQEQINEFIENSEMKNSIEPEDNAHDKNSTEISKIFLTTASFSLSEYADRLKRRVFYKPEFQRNKVWTPQGQSKFIESLILGYPITQVLLYKNINEESYMIVDGFQRITTIYEFMNNQLTLTGVSDNLNTLIFDKLPENIKEKLLNRQLPALIIEQVEEDPFTLYKIFERVNTGGQNLNNMEVRRAVAYGKFIQTLESLNKDENWRKILGSKIDTQTNKYITNNRFLDVELLLRLAAFYYSWDKTIEVENKDTGRKELGELRIRGKNTKNEIEDEKYKSIKSFLTNFLENNKNDSKGDFANLFKKTCALVIRELGDNPFKLYNKYNYVLLDSVMTAILLAGGEVKNLKEKFEQAKSDSEFRKIYEAKQGTIAPNQVNSRIRIVSNIIK